MDKDTRNAIERATQQARQLLEGDFAEQLNGTFDVFVTRRDGKSDVAADGWAEKPGAHLDANPRFLAQREKIVAALEHKRAAGLSREASVVDYLRDAAFTTLNRFVALKMLEARELVQECVTRGEQSSGYQEFCGLAPAVALLPDAAGYRLYIESLFDELSTEIKVLFDRRDPASVLWPKRATFDQLLEILNRPALATVWGEDETIGWVYQYFNGEDDRHKARYNEQGKPKMPGNARELAVRNQFFTPRYVVQFLTDNTLGRIWYEMRGTKTALAERCEYLLRKPGGAVESREKKDPRDLKVLDPACGSGHFLLYAFELFVTIYQEAHGDPESPKSEVTGRTIMEDYSTIDELRRALPELILAHNLHGVDIDARCAQIAQLALWMRAQRAYQDFAIKRGDRRLIRSSNIVVAEPFAADEKLAKEFLRRLNNQDQDLGKVFIRLVNELGFASEMGLLLRIEKHITPTTKRGESGNLFAPPKERVRTALSQFVLETPEPVSVRARLFTTDTEHGLELAQLACQQYDAILMNPPFGEISQRAEKTLDAAYDAAKGNLYIAFLYRMVELLSQGGRLGAITDATLIHQTRYEELRSDLLDPDRLSIHILVANGWGVLDAYVETACLVLSKTATSHLVALDIREAGDDRLQTLRKLTQAFAGDCADPRIRKLPRAVFAKLPKKVLTFWLPAELLTLYDAQPSLAPTLVDARCGMSSSDNPRFYKLRWEVAPADIGDGRKWRFLANGGPPSPLFRHQTYVVNWAVGGREIKAQVAVLYGSASRTIINESYYLEGGLTYGKRTESFTAQFLPKGQIFSNEGQAIFPNSRRDEYGLLAYLNASCIAFLLNAIAGQHKEAGYVGSIPSPPEGFLRSPWVLQRTQRALEILRKAARGVPESHEFIWPFGALDDFAKSAEALHVWLLNSSDELERLFVENDSDLEEVIGFKEGSETPWERRRWRLAPIIYGCEEAELGSAIATDLLGYMLGVAFGRWFPAPVAPGAPRDPLEELEATLPAQSADSSQYRKRILVDDAGHPDDIVSSLEYVQNVMEAHGTSAGELARACAQLDPHRTDIRIVIRAQLFSSHIERYTRSRRKAPIYWQLATPSGSYSAWLYFHALTKDALFVIQHDYAGPKLVHEERRLGSMRHEFGENPSAGERKRIADQENFVEELRTFRDEVQRVAPLWNPDFDDGVVINFAPLWRLVPHNKSWQKELKATWDGLCAEGYDWAHLAMHLWPERVVPKCAKDRSLAIAHGIEEVFWMENSEGKWVARETPTRPVDELIHERASPAVKAALDSLLQAPVAQNGRGRSRSRRARAGSA